MHSIIKPVTGLGTASGRRPWFCALGLGLLLAGSLPGRAADYVSLVTNTPNLVGYWRFDPVFVTNSLVNGYTGKLMGHAQIGGPESGSPVPLDPANSALLLISALYDASQGSTLQIAPADQAVLITWSTNFISYSLQTNASVADPLGWAVLTTNYGLLGAKFAVTNPLAGPQLFYRLAR
jgi:hypothetical protein